ncbi:hypothetical protein Y1Q_0010337 [Alligator mississippiensis]|uniref:Uncharacterized protein n=1 Tax=Alligator mississippiensis TaxID=8496 RepID=A0A151NMF1_ALLMI|nr:hypothetical protein Y1Q_0010337 [Alligator mississippiensis]
MHHLVRNKINELNLTQKLPASPGSRSSAICETMSDRMKHVSVCNMKRWRKIWLTLCSFSPASSFQGLFTAKFKELDSACDFSSVPKQLWGKDWSRTCSYNEDEKKGSRSSSSLNVHHGFCYPQNKGMVLLKDFPIHFLYACQVTR